MIPGQTFEGRNQNLNYANKLVRSYMALLGGPGPPQWQGTAEGGRWSNFTSTRADRPSWAMQRPLGP